MLNCDTMKKFMSIATTTQAKCLNRILYEQPLSKEGIKAYFDNLLEGQVWAEPIPFYTSPKMCESNALFEDFDWDLIFSSPRNAEEIINKLNLHEHQFGTYFLTVANGHFQIVTAENTDFADEYIARIKEQDNCNQICADIRESIKNNRLTGEAANFVYSMCLWNDGSAEYRDAWHAIITEPDWKDKIKKLVNEGCTDSDIEDLTDEYPEEARNIWIFVAELSVPEECRGCKYVEMSRRRPCNCCSRQVEVKDYYEKRED